jgi:hypothetical protein
MRSRRVAIAVAIVLVPLLAYPLVTIAGGEPRFPSRSECARPAHPGDAEVEVVYGRFASPDAAEELRAKVVAVGFVGTDVAVDACGLWKVRYDSLESFDQGQALAEEARKAGLDARLESRP